METGSSILSSSCDEISTTRRNAIKSGIGAASLVLGGGVAAPVAISTATVAIATAAKAEQASYDADVTEPAAS